MLLAFDVREGEYGRALLMQLNIFLIVLILLIVKPVVNALFLANVGIERLPEAFLLVAVAAMVVSTIYARKLGRVPLNRIITSTLGSAAGALYILVLFLWFAPGGVWIYYALYTVVAIFGVVATSQVWILASLLFSNREAARLFGFIGAGAIAGGITGGYITSIFAPLISNDNLIVVAATLLLGCIPLSQVIWKKNVSRLNILQKRKRSSNFGEHPLRLILGSRHLLYLASIVGVGVIVAKLVDYQFSALASASIESSDDLAAFFGFWFSTFNVVSLVIQLFLTRRVVGLYGVGLSLFVLPVAIILGAGLLLFIPILSIGIFVKASDVTLKQSINKSATELLALPVPVSIKNQTKSFIDIFVDSAATGIGGIVLIFMVSVLGLSVRFISLVVLPLAVLWIYFARNVRREYLDSFKSRLEKLNKRDESEKVIAIDSETIVGSMRKVLQRGSEDQVVYMLNRVGEMNDARLLEDVLPHLHSDSDEVRIATLSTLYHFRQPNLSQQVEAFLSDPNPTVRVRAVEYLIEHSGDKRVEVIDKYLKHENEDVNLAALVGLAIEARNNPEMLKLFKFEKRLAEKIGYLNIIEDDSIRHKYQTAIARAIGNANLPQHFAVLLELLDSENPAIVNEAILAAGQTLDVNLAESVITKLPDKQHRQSAIRSLVACGPGILNVMSELLARQKVSIEAIRWFPSVAEQIGEQSAVSFLFRLAEHSDLQVQIEALRALNNLKLKNPYLAVDRKDLIELIVEQSKIYLQTLSALYAERVRISHQAVENLASINDARQSLVTLLEKRLDVVLERIFRLLGLRYPPEDIIPIYEGLHSDSQDIRTNAVEYLDSLLYGNLKRILIPIVESAILQTVTEDTIKRLNIDVPDQKQSLATLLGGRDIRIKLAVLYLIEQLRDPQYLSLIRQYVNDDDRRVRDFARRAEEKTLAAATA